MPHLLTTALILAQLLPASSVIPTPCGPRPVECVREAPHRSHITFSTPTEPHDFNIHHHNGTLERFTVPQSCHDYFATMTSPPTGPTLNNPPNGSFRSVPNGWIESAGVYRMDPTSTIHSFDAQWTVPPAYV